MLTATSRRKRGGQPANQNAVTHGRHRAAAVAERKATAKAAAEERQLRDRDWAAKMPMTDYGAIIDDLRHLRAKAGL